MTRGDETRVHLKLALRRELYGWVRDRVAGRVVLDLGCGAGAGSALLAEAADRVLAVDHDPAALRQARAADPLGRIVPLRMDAGSLALADRSVHAVVAIAFLEYVDDLRTALDEAVRVLAPGGLIVCATTNAAMTPKARDGGPLYRDHVEELTADELRRELEARVEDVRLYGAVSEGPAARYLVDRRAMAVESVLIRARLKHVIPIRVRNLVRRLVTGVDVERVIASGFRIVEGRYEESIYVTALGWKRPGR